MGILPSFLADVPLKKRSRMLLPWEYGVRNLTRRPVRTLLTLLALSIVILLVFVVVGFIRGMEQSLATSGEPNVVLVYSKSSEQNIESSSIAGQTASLLSANVSKIKKIGEKPMVSPEIYLGSRIRVGEQKEGQGDGHGGLGLIRAVTPEVVLVRKKVRIEKGKWPSVGEVMVGGLAYAKVGVQSEDFAIGKSIQLEGKSWKISGIFSAGKSAYESEIWCNLAEFQTATKRQDLSLVALQMKSKKDVGYVQKFCNDRNNLELTAVDEQEYYQGLQKHYGPVRILAWSVVWLVSGAGVFAGLNMMFGAVAGRTSEIATLQVLGFRRIAILLSLMQEGLLLSAAGSILSGIVALGLLNGLAVRFTMGAFSLRIDGLSLMVGCGVGLALGILGALPPAIRVLRAPVVTSLRSN